MKGKPAGQATKKPLPFFLSVSAHYKNKTISFSRMIHLVKKSIRA